MRSYPLFSVCKVPVLVHPLVPVLVLGVSLLYLYRGLGVAAEVFAFLSLAFVSLFLHEMGHALAARAQRLPVSRVTLYAYGGVATIGPAELSPRQELRVAIAGPAANSAIFLLLLGTGVLVDLPEILANVMLFNLLLALLNLVPGYLPVRGIVMDGGRILRSLLACRLPYPRARWATADIARWISVVIGILCVALMGLTGIHVLINWVALSIAVVLFLGAREELAIAGREVPTSDVPDFLRGASWDEPQREPCASSRVVRGDIVLNPEPSTTDDGAGSDSRPSTSDRIIEVAPDGSVERIYLREEDENSDVG